MRTHLSLLCCMLLLNISMLFSQNKLDSLGRKTGWWVFEEENNTAFGGFTLTNCEYRDGLKNGKCIVKNKKEEVLAEINFVNDKKEGQAIRYQKGRVQEIAVFKSDDLVQKQTYINGRMYESEFYTNYKDTVVLSAVYAFRWRGKKWMWQKYENGDLKSEVFYNRRGKVELDTEYDSQGKGSTSTK